MTPTVRKFVEIVASVHHQGPVLEIGSQQVPGLEKEANLREFFPTQQYVGMDLRAGPGVDLIADVHRSPFQGTHFGAVLGCEVLEHCRYPALAVANMVSALNKEGILVVTTPFLLGIHHMPDYWRFTPQGMDLLLSDNHIEHRAVYFKGDVWLPSAILAVGAKSYSAFRRVEIALDTRLGELPADRPEDHVFRWAGEREYVRLRSQFLKPVEFKFIWTQEDANGRP